MGCQLLSDNNGPVGGMVNGKELSNRFSDLKSVQVLSSSTTQTTWLMVGLTQKTRGNLNISELQGKEDVDDNGWENSCMRRLIWR